jgi:hypothetical protein
MTFLSCRAAGVYFAGLYGNLKKILNCNNFSFSIKEAYCE